MNKELTRVMAEIIREQAIKKQAVKVDGLGTFKPIHRKQYQTQYRNGRVVMMPPTDYILFTPDKQ